MKNIRYSSIILSSLMLFSGCSLSSVNSKASPIDKTLSISEKIEQGSQKELKRSLNIQAGDTAKTIFERLSFIDKNIYIVENGELFTSKFAVNNIENIDALDKFFLANDYVLKTTKIEDSNYIKVSIFPNLTEAEKKLKQTEVSLTGSIPIGDAIKMFAQKADVIPMWEDKTANNLSLVNRTLSFKGNALDALEYVAASADLSVSYKENKVIVSYFKTETMSLDIFTRDRESNTDINIEMKQNTQSSAGGATSSGASGLSSGSGQDLTVKYKSVIIKDLESSLESILSKQGSFTFLPSSGQILVRDKNENVKLAQKLISDFNSKFKDTIEITITLYKVSKEKGDTRGVDFKALGSKFDFSATDMISSVSSGFTGGATYGVGYTNKNNDSAVLNFLREQGDTEILNPISFETQSNILKTVKVANNYGYISSIQTTSDSNTGTTASVTPSSVADGGFISTIAKVIDNDTIAIDLYSTTASLSRFNSVTAFGNTVQTPDTAEQSIDGYHRVKVGVPYILVSHKYEESKNNSAGLPIKQLESLGYNSDSSKDIYIVIALEAKIRK